MNWTIQKKLAAITICFVVAMVILGGVSFFTLKRVAFLDDLAERRDEQVSIVTKLINMRSTVMLAAMEVILDKDEGKIASERMQVINASVDVFEANLPTILELADTGEEKRLAEAINTNFPKLAKGVQVDLPKLISSNAGAAEFEKFDNLVDNYGDKIEDDLQKIIASVEKEQKEASENLHNLVALSITISIVVFVLSLAIILTVVFLIVRSITGPLGRIINGVSEASAQVSSAADQISDASQQLASGTSEQAASVEETSSSLEETAAMANQNADNAIKADSLMSEINDVVDEAGVAMKQLNGSMEEINEASDETSKIVKTIDEIAFQTNLLALNAAVEAARAGEAGAGFAVVAEEVRNLAMRAAEAAKNTSDLIEETAIKVKNGGEISSRTNESFIKVAEGVQKARTLIGEIKVASQEQSQGITQINVAVGEIDKVTQQNAATSEEAASSSEEMSAQAAQMMEYVKELAVQIGSDVHLEQTAVRSRSTVFKQPSALQERRQLQAPHVKPGKPGKEEKKTPPTSSKPEDVIPFDDDADFEDF